MYVINSPALVDKAMKNSDVSFDPFVVPLTRPMFNYTDKQLALFEDEARYPPYMQSIHQGLSGASLSKINVSALGFMMEVLQHISEDTYLDIPDIFVWLRDVTSLGIGGGLFGVHNPITPEHFALLA